MQLLTKTVLIMYCSTMHILILFDIFCNFVTVIIIGFKFKMDLLMLFMHKDTTQSTS
jgi:hypothetical protein